MLRLYTNTNLTSIEIGFTLYSLLFLYFQSFVLYYLGENRTPTHSKETYTQTYSKETRTQVSPKETRTLDSPKEISPKLIQKFLVP